MLRSINRVNTPPNVSIPRESGVTSSKRTSLTSPFKTAPWIAAPAATTSSGFTPRCGSLPKKFLTVSMIFGIRVIPPTKITSSMSPALSPASFKAAWHGAIVRLTRSSTKDSNLARVSFTFKCFGPEASAVMNGKFTSVCMEDDNSIFAFSAASFKRCKAIVSLRRSIPASFLNSSARYSIIRLSKSSPPRNVSPLVDLTSKTPSPISRIETSNVPPPKS